ncbi:MAG TPA: PLP-dependent transferase, partial [Candidatus Angelobacter sp.]|nr:PLP-dependent transferase [Candidatus Angelobacter sp.]
MTPKKDWTTKLIHSDARVPEGFRSLATTVYRGSTVLFSDAADITDDWDQYANGYTYGLYGTPTTLELAGKICELEGGFHTLITPGGQCAVSTIHLAFLNAGDHILVPESIYGPNRKLTRFVLRRFGVETTFYPPGIGGEIKSLFQPNTRMVWCESPGSITMEVQDVPGIAVAAHAHGALVVMDNTWAAGVLFDALAHGVDISMQAVTKYVAGHSDVLLGAITVKDEALWSTLGAHQQVLGAGASPDDCSLALRGMK